MCQAENHVWIQFFTHKKEACSSGSHHRTYLIGISWLQTEKKFPWHWVQSEAAVFHWQWLTGLVWKDVFFSLFFVFFLGGGGGCLINCPKVLMSSACSESRSFNLSYHTVTVPRFTTVVCYLFSLGEIVSWFSQTVSTAIVLRSST